MTYLSVIIYSTRVILYLCLAARRLRDINQLLQYFSFTLFVHIPYLLYTFIWVTLNNASG